MSEKQQSEPRNEELIYSEKIIGQSKLFYVDYKENNRGRFLKITEKDGKFRNTIIVPEEALFEFGEVVAKIVEHHRADCPEDEDVSID